MQILQRHRAEIIGLTFLLIFYLLLRLWNLGGLPIFTDEAIYMRWAQIALNDSNWRFISLTDGKQPLFIWFTMIFQKIVEDPLIAGRMVSVIAGIFSLVGIILLSYEVFKNKTVAFLSGLLYVVYPFSQVYDRMALMDGMVGAFAIWGLLFGVLLVRRINLTLAYTLGFIVGGAALTKSNGFFSAYLLPFTLLLFNFKQKKLINRLFRWAIFAAVAFGISQAMYSVLRLSPFFHIIEEKNQVFVYSISDWLSHPLTYFMGNFQGLFGWLITYLTPAFIILIFAGLISRGFLREKLLLVAYFALPFLALALFGKVIFPRHFYFMTLSLIPIAAFGLSRLNALFQSKIKMQYAHVLLTILFIAYPLYVSLQFAVNPLHAPIADSDIKQYISEWPAGWGVSESVAYLKQESQNQKIFVGTEGTFGLMPFSLELYLVNNPNIILKSYWPINDTPPSDLVEASQTIPTFVLFYQPCPSCSSMFEPPPTWSVEKVMQAPRGNLAIYRVLSK